MKEVAAMDVRKHFGAILDEVRLKAETIILTRGGKPIAMLSPLKTASAPSETTKRRIRALKQLKGLGKSSQRAKDVGLWLEDERKSWEDRHA